MNNVTSISGEMEEAEKNKQNVQKTYGSVIHYRWICILII